MESIYKIKNKNYKNEKRETKNSSMGTQNVHWELFNTGLLAIVIWDMASGQVQNYFFEKETKLSSFDFAASS